MQFKRLLENPFCRLDFGCQGHYGPNKGRQKKKGPCEGFSSGLCTDTRRFWVRCKMLAVGAT